LSDADLKELSKPIHTSNKENIFSCVSAGNIRRGALCTIISLTMLNCMLVWPRVNLKLHPAKPA